MKTAFSNDANLVNMSVLTMIMTVYSNLLIKTVFMINAIGTLYKNVAAQKSMEISTTKTLGRVGMYWRGTMVKYVHR